METRTFGRTGHQSSVLVYGAAGLGGVDQQTADDSLARAFLAGINHYDTAASYGHAEKVMGPSVPGMRHDIFLATKTTERSYEAAWREINRSLELLQTDHVDLLQVHAVCNPDDLEKVFADGGPLRAFERAREEGMTNYLGITGHTELAPSTHLEALRRFDFDSVLCPLNHQLYSTAQYRDDFDALSEVIVERNLGLRVIKAIARRPWQGDDHRFATWYEPFDDIEHITAAISWVLGKFPQVTGLATAGETTLLPLAIQAEANRIGVDEADELLKSVEDYRSIFQ